MNGITLAIRRHDSLRPPGIKFRPFVNRVCDTIFPVHPLDVTFIRWGWHVVILSFFLATPYSWAFDHSRWSTEPNWWIRYLSELCGWGSSCLLLQTAIIATDNSSSKLWGFKVKMQLGKLWCLWEDNLMPRNLAERSSRIDVNLGISIWFY